MLNRGGDEPDIGVAALVAGHTEAWVFRAPRDRCFKALRQIGDLVSAGEIVGETSGEPVCSMIAG